MQQFFWQIVDPTLPGRLGVLNPQTAKEEDALQMETRLLRRTVDGMTLTCLPAAFQGAAHVSVNGANLSGSELCDVIRAAWRSAGHAHAVHNALIRIQDMEGPRNFVLCADELVFSITPAAWESEYPPNALQFMTATILSARLLSRDRAAQRMLSPAAT